MEFRDFFLQMNDISDVIMTFPKWEQFANVPKSVLLPNFK